MSWASEQAEYQDWLTQERYIDHERRMSRAKRITELFNNIPDATFLDYVLLNGDKESMNTLVPNGAFKAYDIAYRLRDTDTRPTKKQRTAIANVYIFTETKLRPEEIAAD